MMKNMPGTSKPRIWCPEEDYHSRNGGIAMSTTSGSSNCGSSREIEAVAYHGTRSKQQGDLFILEPSGIDTVDFKRFRYRFVSSTSQTFPFTRIKMDFDLGLMIAGEPILRMLK